MKALTITELNEILVFIDLHHKVHKVKSLNDVNKSIDAGVKPEMAKFHLNIKYVKPIIDIRYNEVYSLSINQYCFRTNKKPKDENFQYNSLYSLVMDFLKGVYKPHSVFLTNN